MNRVLQDSFSEFLGPDGVVKMEISAIAIFSIALLIPIIFINLNFWKFWKKKGKEEKEGPEEPSSSQKQEEPLDLTEFMVGYRPPPQVEEEKVEEQIYSPGEGVDHERAFDPAGRDSDHLMGHEVEVKDLPEAEEEEIDASWVNLEMNRDLRQVLEELENKKVNCYDILEVEPNASKNDIKKAYRNLATKYHPDKGAVLGAEAMERIRDINYSKGILLDPTMRALHDEMIRKFRKEEAEIEPVEEPPSIPFPTGIGRASTGDSISDDVSMSSFVEEVDGVNGVGVLFFRKWDEGHEGFETRLMDYFIDLDDQGFIDYGMVMKGDIDDMEDISKMKRISNFPMAVNNTLFDVWERPPFYYLAVPIMQRENAQELCDILKDSFGLDSIFFQYPLI